MRTTNKKQLLIVVLPTLAFINRRNVLNAAYHREPDGNYFGKATCGNAALAASYQFAKKMTVPASFIRCV